jgi:hypothetical protein
LRGAATLLATKSGSSGPGTIGPFSTEARGGEAISASAVLPEEAGAPSAGGADQTCLTTGPLRPERAASPRLPHISPSELGEWADGASHSVPTAVGAWAIHGLGHAIGPAQLAPIRAGRQRGTARTHSARCADLLDALGRAARERGARDCPWARARNVTLAPMFLARGGTLVSIRVLHGSRVTSARGPHER